MAQFGSFNRYFSLLASTAAILFAFPYAFASVAEAGDEVGWPYRGPLELSGGAGGGADQTTGGGDDSGGDSGGDDGSGGDTGDGSGSGTDTGGGTGGGNTSAPGPGGKASSFDGKILWSWWWEHNKDRFLARATARGRVNAGSTLFWFGSGAKFPPRDLTRISNDQRRKIFDVLKTRIQQDKSPAVRIAALMAIGRLGNIEANKKEAEASDVDDKITSNMCARVLLTALRNRGGTSGERNAALLGLGLTGDAKACLTLLRVIKDVPAENLPNAFIAFGLARLPEAIPTIVQQLPKNGNEKDEHKIAAILALGLYGPEFAETIRGEKTAYGKKSIDHLEKLCAGKGSNDAVASQALAAIARLQLKVATVGKATKSKSPSVKYAAILALAEYAGSEDMASRAWKSLKKAYKGSRQIQNFVILSSGDLASRLGANSPTRRAIIKSLSGKKFLGSNDNFIRSCVVIALGVAQDTKSVPAIVDLLNNSTIDHYVAAACSVSLGLLKAADHADVVLRRVVNGKFNAEAKSYGLIGIALMGDTTRINELLKFTDKKQQEIARQVPLAIGVLGGGRQSPALTSFFKQKWPQAKRLQASSAVFGLSWIRDASSVDSLTSLTSSNGMDEVRAMAAIALGYIASEDRVSGLTRCFENTNYRWGFDGFKTLLLISRIL